MSATAAPGLGARLVKATRQAVWLLLVSLLVCVIAWFVRPTRLPLTAQEAFYASELTAPLVSVAEALSLYEAGSHIFVDARSAAARGGIPGSLSVREESLDDDLFEHRDFLYPEDPVILWGDGNLQSLSAIAARLQERGFQDVRILAGGLAAWQRSDGPIAGDGAGP
jgi:rhodanese-related sulfurtransferase